MKISLLFNDNTYCWIAYNTLNDGCSLPYHLCRMKFSTKGGIFKADYIGMFEDFTSYATRAEEIYNWLRRTSPREVVVMEPEILRERINSIK